MDCHSAVRELAWLHCNIHAVAMTSASTHSAGLYIKKKRSINSSFSFKDYLPGVQEESEKLLQKAQQGVYPYTMKVATTMAVKQMAKDDPNLYKVGGCSMLPHTLYMHTAKINGLL